MAERRTVLEPQADHPLVICSLNGVKLRLGDQEPLAVEALELREAAYASVVYVILPNEARGRFSDSPTRSWCPYKGEAHYLNYVAEDGGVIQDAAWFYPAAHGVALPLRGAVAFYPGKSPARVER